MARLRTERVEWVGTSMGGIVSMLLTALPNTPIQCLVPNDVGLLMSKKALKRIAVYVGQHPHFQDLDEVKHYLREINAPFSDLTDDQWTYYARHHARHAEEGGYRLAYDSAIALTLKDPNLGDVDVFPVYEAIRCPVLLLRGGDTDVLLAETAEQMCNRGPQAALVEFPGIGQVPLLVNEEQIEVVKKWLSQGSRANGQE